MSVVTWLLACLAVFVVSIAVSILGNWISIKDAWNKGSQETAVFLAAEGTVLAITFFLFVFDQTHKRVRSFYFARARVLNWLRPGKSPTWDVQAHLRGRGGPAVLDEIEGALRKLYSGRLSTMKRLDNMRLLLADGRFNVELRHQYEPDSDAEDGCSMNVRLFAMTVSFSEATARLREDVLTVLTQVATAIGAPANEQSYSLTVTFPGETNPFLPAYVEQLHPEEVINFQLVLKMQHALADAREQVDLRKNTLTIRAQSLQVLRDEAEAFAQFQPRRL